MDVRLVVLMLPLACASDYPADMGLLHQSRAKPGQQEIEHMNAYCTDMAATALLQRGWLNTRQQKTPVTTAAAAAAEVGTETDATTISLPPPPRCPSSFALHRFQPMGSLSYYELVF